MAMHLVFENTQDLIMNSNRLKPKVLYIETGMGFGGSAVSLFEIVTHLRNHEPAIAFFSSENNGFTTCFADYNACFLNARFTYLHKALFYKGLHRLIKNDFLRKIISKLYTAASIVDDYALYKKIVRVAQKESVSLVHVNNCIHPVALRAAKKLGVPAIVHLRGHVDCVGFGNNKINDLFYTLLAPTKKIQNFAIDSLGVPREKTRVIYDTVAPESYALRDKGKGIRSDYGIADETVVIGMFARIIPMKGQLELARAIDRLLSTGNEITCMFIGDISDGDIDYLNTLKDFIKNSSSPESFVFTGYRDDAPAFYNAIDIAVHGSVDDEAFGRVIIEAWASHKPVIATDIEASVELIDDGRTGIIVPVGDIEKLASEILLLARSAEKRERLASNGYKRMLESFSSDAVTKLIEDIYSKLLRAG